MSRSPFVNSESWNQIKRGYYQAALYFMSDTKQPLNFLEKTDENTYQIINRYGDFSPAEVEGRKRALPQNIAVTLKPRQVIVLSSDEINHLSNFEYVQVAPVFGIKHHDTQTSWYHDLKNDALPGFAYIPKGKNGIEVDLTQISSIHKSLLLEKQNKVPNDRMNFIDSHILELLDL